MKLSVFAALILAAIANAQDISCAKPCIQQGIQQSVPECGVDIKCICSHSQAILNSVKPCVESKCGPVSDDKIHQVMTQYCG